VTWAERRRHDLVVSHRLAEYFNPDDREKAEHLIDHLVELEQLDRAIVAQGGDTHDLGRIEDACWPVREKLRILDRENLLPRVEPWQGTPLPSYLR